MSGGRRAAVQRSLARPHLLDALDRGAGTFLTLVSAPAGFGKTTLLAQWAAQRDAPTAWVSLGDADREPDALVAHLLAAVREVAPEVDAVDPLPGDAAAALAGYEGLAIVLDEYEHLAESPAADETLWQFAVDRPLAVQLVVSGRIEPTTRLAAQRARGELIEIKARDLRFSDDDARELVAGDIAPEDIDELVERCAGWAAALRLAADAGSPTEGESRLRELVVDLLADREDERAFLVESSILDELSAPLCDAVLGHQRSAAILERLVRENLFVESTPRDGTYRLLPAARRVLRAELDRATPRAAPKLHRRAAAWYRSAPVSPEREIEHLLAAGDVGLAARRTARVWPQLAGSGTHPTVLRWLDRFPVDPDDVRLALARGWLLRLDGRYAESEAWLDAARRAAPARAGRGVVRSYTLARAAAPWDDVGGAVARARRAWRSERGGPNRALAAWSLGWAAWWSGDDVEAATLLADALAGPVLVSVAAQAVLARIALARGDVDEAASFAGSAVASAAARGLLELPPFGMVATAAGAVAAARGEGAPALAELERGIHLRRTWGHPLETADALVVAAPVAAALHGRQAAAALLAEARLLVDSCTDAGILAARLAQAARSALPKPGARGGGDDLTPRERTVLRLLASGLSKRAIAGELFVSFNTVHSHTKSIYRKLGASSRDEAVERMRELGLF